MHILCSPTVEEGFLPRLEFVCSGCHCISKLYELAAERDFAEEEDEGVQPGDRRGGTQTGEWIIFSAAISDTTQLWVKWWKAGGIHQTATVKSPLLFRLHKLGQSAAVFIVETARQCLATVDCN